MYFFPSLGKRPQHSTRPSTVSASNFFMGVFLLSRRCMHHPMAFPSYAQSWFLDAALPRLLPSLPSHRTLSADTLSTRPFLVDGRSLLPSLPSHRTLSAATLSTRPFLVDGRPLPSHRTLFAIRTLPLVDTSSLPSHRTLSANTLSTRPFLVDGRPLLPSLPSHRTLSADTYFVTAFPSMALAASQYGSSLPSRLGPSSSMAVHCSLLPSRRTLSADTYFAAFPSSMAVRSRSAFPSIRRPAPTSLPSRRTLSADTYFAAFPSYALC